MGRWDHDDPQDEHDINELRNYVQRGSEPMFVGKQKKGCAVVAIVVLGAVVAAGYGAVELAGSLMCAAVPAGSTSTQTAGRHARPSTWRDEIRHLLLALFVRKFRFYAVTPEELRRSEWKAIKRSVRRVAGWAAAVVTVVGVDVLWVIGAIPTGAVLAAGGVLVGWLVVWRLRAAARQVGVIVAEEAPRWPTEFDAPTEVLHIQAGQGDPT